MAPQIACKDRLYKKVVVQKLPNFEYSAINNEMIWSFQDVMLSSHVLKIRTNFLPFADYT